MHCQPTPQIQPQNEAHPVSPRSALPSKAQQSKGRMTNSSSTQQRQRHDIPSRWQCWPQPCHRPPFYLGIIFIALALAPALGFHALYSRTSLRDMPRDLSEREAGEIVSQGEYRMDEGGYCLNQTKPLRLRARCRAVPARFTSRIFIRAASTISSIARGANLM